MAPQLIWVGLAGLELEVRVPLPLPAFAAVNATPTLTVKLLVLVAVPPGVATLSGPVVAPAGTVAWIAVAEVTVKAALTPLNVTAVAPVKFVPMIVTLYPSGPYVGEKLVIAGGWVTVKLLALAAEPVGPDTRIGPVVAPAGTVV